MNIHEKIRLEFVLKKWKQQAEMAEREAEIWIAARGGKQWAANIANAWVRLKKRKVEEMQKKIE